MLSLFTENLLPVFLAAGAGWILAAWLSVDPRPLAQTAFHVLAPCLIFRIVIDSGVHGDALARMAGFTAVVLLGLGVLAALLARAVGCKRSMIAAVVLVVLLPNAGNFGLSASLFAFGDAGLAQAGVFFITSAILTFTVGIVVASLGRTGLGGTLVGLIRVPSLWAVVLAFGLGHYDQTLPVPVDRTVRLLAQASIPVFLIILGVQLHGKGVRGPWRPLVLATGLRLFGGAAAGLLLAVAFGLEGTARRAGVLQSAMPSAVITIVLATEYDVEPRFVTSVVVLTTLLSPITLTPLLAWLGG